MRNDYKLLLILLVIALITTMALPQTKAMTPVEKEQVKATHNCEIWHDYIAKVATWTIEAIQQHSKQKSTEQTIEEEPSLLVELLSAIYKNYKANN